MARVRSSWFLETSDLHGEELAGRIGGRMEEADPTAVVLFLYCGNKDRCSMGGSHLCLALIMSTPRPLCVNQAEIPGRGTGEVVIILPFILPKCIRNERNNNKKLKCHLKNDKGRGKVNITRPCLT